MKAMFGLVCAIGTVAACAAEFPYDVTEMTVRNRTEGVSVYSLGERADVPAVDGGMPRTDSVAQVFTGKAYFIATCASDWAAAQAAVGAAQAGLAIHETDSGLAWAVYSNGAWVDAVGAVAEDDEWFVRVDLDYSLGAGERRIRYAVSKDGNEYDVLSHGGETWLPIGTEAERIGAIEFYGCGDTGSVTAQSGRRTMNAVAALSEEFKMDYSDFKVDIGVTDAWGVEGADVTLVGPDGEFVVRRGVLENGHIVVDFSDVAVPGGSYGYQALLTGGYNGLAFEQEAGASQIDLFSNVDWFGFSNGAFSKASADGNLLVTEGALRLVDPMVRGFVTPVLHCAEDSRITLMATVDVQGATGEADLPAGEVQFGLTLARLADGTRSWMCATDEGWMAVSGDGVGTENGAYDVKFDLDYRNAPRGAYSVRVGDRYVRLMAGVDEWFGVPSGKHSFDKISLLGTGAVSTLAASYFATTAVPREVKPHDGVITLDENTEIDLTTSVLLETGTGYEVTGSSGHKYRMKWSDSKTRYATMKNGVLTIHAGVPANGLGSFTSHALGLDPTKARDKPAAVVKEGGMQAADGVTVHVPNVVRANLPDVGVEVFFQRQKSVDGGKTWTDDGAAVSVGGELTIPFAQGTLYRVNTVLK